MSLESQTPRLKVAEYMTTDPITVQSDITFTDAVAKMTSNRIGNLIVVENKKTCWHPYRKGDPTIFITMGKNSQSSA